MENIIFKASFCITTLRWFLSYIYTVYITVEPWFMTCSMILEMAVIMFFPDVEFTKGSKVSQMLLLLANWIAYKQVLVNWDIGVSMSWNSRY